MPDNNLFNPNDLPKKNDDNNTSTNNLNQPIEEHKDLIEIPQAYYDKLAKEEQEKQNKAQAEMLKKQEVLEAKKSFNSFASIVLINAILIFASTYTFLNINELLILLIPGFIVFLTFYSAFKHKKDSTYPISLLIGGIIVAVVTFIISMIKVEELDLWTHYTIVAVVIGFLGAFTSNIITKIITSFKEIKALEFTGYIIYFILLIGIPIFLEHNYRTEFHQFVFLEQVAVEAENEEDFILKTLQVRYGEKFTCENKVQYQVDENNRKQNTRKCKSSSGIEIDVTSKDYQELNNKFIIIDNYIDRLYLDNSKSQLIDNLQAASQANKIELYLYPEINCTFYGDCADCDEYYTRYNEETSIEHQYEQSIKLNFTKELNNDSKSFINNQKFKYIINVISTYDENNTDYQSIIDRILNEINNKGYKNTFGYVINIYSLSSSSLGDTNKLVYKVKGSTNNEQIFKDPEVVDISGYRAIK